MITPGPITRHIHLLHQHDVLYTILESKILVAKSCVPLSKGASFVQVRSDLLAVCEGNHCRSAVLQRLIDWTDHKLKKLKGAESGASPDDVWVFRTQEELSSDILRLFARDTVALALDWLIKHGLIETRKKPRFRGDRTKHYRVCVEEIRRRLQEHGGTEKSAQGNQRKEDIKTEKSVIESQTMADVKTETSATGMPRNGHAMKETRQKESKDISSTSRIDYGMPRKESSTGTGPSGTWPPASSDPSRPAPDQTVKSGEAIPSISAWPDGKMDYFIRKVAHLYPRTAIGMSATAEEVAELAQTLSYEEARQFFEAVKRFSSAVDHGYYDNRYVWGFRKFSGTDPVHTGPKVWKKWITAACGTLDHFVKLRA